MTIALMIVALVGHRILRRGDDQTGEAGQAVQGPYGGTKMVEYIEKEAVQKIICGWCGVCKSPTVCDLMHCDDICPQFAQIPAADVRPVVRGKWIKTVGENGITSACRCNECGFEDNRYSLFNFCPNCGADMRPEPQEEGET